MINDSLGGDGDCVNDDGGDPGLFAFHLKFSGFPFHLAGCSQPKRSQRAWKVGFAVINWDCHGDNEDG